MRPVFIAVYLAVIIHAPLAAILSLNHYSQMQHDSASHLMINKPAPSASPRPHASFAMISLSSECSFSPAQAAGGGGCCASWFKFHSQLTLCKCTNCSSDITLCAETTLQHERFHSGALYRIEPIGLKEKTCFSGQNKQGRDIKKQEVTSHCMSVCSLEA